jgi:SAM-dependent methyltransferase
LRLLVRRDGPIGFKSIFLLLFYPLDSTRHFEQDFAWRFTNSQPLVNYLDVSSPRMTFSLLLRKHPQLRAELINPDKADLAETEMLLRAAGLLPRCRLHGCLIGEAPFVPASFDLITCISVLEHIPNDSDAVRFMWRLLKPGGRLILTVPCAATTSEQYIDRDEYGLYGNESQQVFWQRFYDETLLNERVIAITGTPKRKEIYGERSSGLFLRMAERKRKDRYYPFWREPYMTALEYSFFNSLAELPGEGVIAMEFVKQ